MGAALDDSFELHSATGIMVNVNKRHIVDLQLQALRRPPSLIQMRDDYLAFGIQPPASYGIAINGICGGFDDPGRFQGLRYYYLN